MYDLLSYRYSTLASWDGQRVCGLIVDDPCCQYGLRSGRPVVQGAVGPEGIVFHSPPFDEHLGLLECVKDLPVEQFVPEFAVEAFTVAVLPGTAGFDIEGAHSCIG